jgi:hypothetical protein
LYSFWSNIQEKSGYLTFTLYLPIFSTLSNRPPLLKLREWSAPRRPLRSPFLLPRSIDVDGIEYRLHSVSASAISILAEVFKLGKSISHVADS